VDVLLVDDSTTDLRLLMELMPLKDLRFSVALDGERGYQQAVALEPSLVLLDVKLPDMDGFTVSRRLKANPSTAAIPVIFLSASTDLAHRLQGFAAGGVDYISKPFEPEEVLARVGVHLQLAARRATDTHPASVGEVAPELPSGSFDLVLVNGAQRILFDRLSDPPSLDELARLMGSNRRRLNEAFQSLCGQPVFSWLREERLRRAYAIVVNTDTSVTVIGDMLGYSSAANFTKAFRDRFGYSPRELRTGIRDGAIPL
jgi:CheY-like chemotaxis protein/AraC-like DNA-binding protein